MNEAIDRLRAMARDALQEYNVQCMKHGGEPEFPQWAKDTLDVCRIAKTQAVELERREATIRTATGALIFSEKELAAARAEASRLKNLINTPHTDDFVEAVKLEAAHQQERWGSAGDAGKSPQDWFWLIGYLAGKSLAAFIRGDQGKGLHHIISSAAALLNWHRHATGEATAMRPGIEAPEEVTQ
ncbi:hypothetical protein EDC30_104256 [Paucimonas lemoignei]|uniref:Uncharacterized protein n=1 Tax=Paucimonas lemoignei TaxID=29443 RepID=A0A4R3HWC9_PAULE|nr:hypothetical protein [Paucimonas lemoignei]TCS37452.1 hypothetical protein EDC30_104256 [Paucimonas lemoignei]